MPTGFGFSAELGAALGELQKANAIGQAQLQLGWRKYQPVTGSITGINGQTAATSIAGPEGGKMWHIRRLTFAPQLGVAVGTAGTIVVGKGTGLQTTSQGSGQIIAATASQFIEVERSPSPAAASGGAPCTFTWGRSEFVLAYPLQIIALWVSGTAGVPLVIDGDAEEYLAETTQPGV